MKNKFYLLPILVLMLSCSKKDTPQPQVEGPVTGRIYTSNFTAQNAVVKNVNFSYQNYKPEDLFAIYLSANKGDDCSADVKNFSVRLSVPKKIGKFRENDIYVLIDDPNSEEGALFSSDSVIEITSITADKVTGTVDAKLENNSIKGRFEAKICQ
ncbi:hypothetical protein [Mucilaginibacter phyllosphaerae]|uniref:Lipoprotein n=1 Tax=Mucilaginibacter phyllosphaerae TaxID=1812349 RepID=A0A4Y8AG60_9SPHI|nr:hypothetical protein [Mucilaginibacter phyllosphaerae]MBB3968605.1 hypothetical protein [Mucilaginibacter phyllosphaerae]TEW67756.1 hypothetical protein E2R65_07145 [Mucilaginibacter phyllosphaerae]